MREQKKPEELLENSGMSGFLKGLPMLRGLGQSEEPESRFPAF